MLTMDFVALTQQCAPSVDTQTMAAIVKTESGFRPLAIGINRGGRLARQPETVEEAVITAKWLIDNGYNIDLGLGQINSSNLRRVGLTVEEAFDPCKNIAAGAKILHGNYIDASRKHISEQAALNAAISAYNTGSFTAGITNGYVQRVISNASVVPRNGTNTTDPIPLISGSSAQRKVRRPVTQPAGKASAPSEASAEERDSWNAYRNSKSNELAF